MCILAGLFCDSFCLALSILLHYSYQYDWKLDEAAKNIMRTHTTAVSARMLYKLAQEVSQLSFMLVLLTAGQCH